VLLAPYFTVYLSCCLGWLALLVANQCSFTHSYHVPG
jgi:hypothetical protein